MANGSKGNGPGAPKSVRCAIYTRKSTDEGLNQDFNSLDAQRESGEAYSHHTELPRLVRSEAHLLALAGGSGFVARIHARRR